MVYELSLSPEIVQTALSPYSHAWNQLVSYSETHQDSLSQEFRSAWLEYKAAIKHTPDQAEQSFMRLNVAARALSVSYFDASWREVRASLTELRKISIVSPPTTDEVRQSPGPSAIDEGEQGSTIYTKEEKEAFESPITSFATDTPSRDFERFARRLEMAFEGGYDASILRPNAHEELTWIGSETAKLALMRDRDMAVRLPLEEFRIEVSKTAGAETFMANLVAAVSKRS